MSALDPGAQAPAPEPAATPEPASSGPDLSSVFDRLDQLGGQVGQLVEGWQGFQQAQQPQEPETNWWESLYEDPQQAEQQQLQEQQAQQQPQQPQLNPDALQNAINQAIQQSTAPLQQQLQSFQQQQALSTLLERVPSLKDPDTAQRTQELVAQQIGHLSPEIQQALVWDPGFIETVFKAAEAEKLAGAQEPAGGQAPQLEAAGGAHPGGTGEEQNIVHRVHGGRAQLPPGLRN